MNPEGRERHKSRETDMQKFVGEGYEFVERAIDMAW